MRTSEQLDKIAAALLAFQKEIEPPTKNKENPYFKSMYADLCSLLEHCKPAMLKHGLVYTSVGMTSRLMHTSGQWIEGDFSCDITGMNAQQVGGAMTYGRRYNFQGLLGINAEDDDDGAKASNTTSGNAAKPAPGKMQLRKLPPSESKIHPPAEQEADRVPAEVTDGQAPVDADADGYETLVLKATTAEKVDKKGQQYKSLCFVFGDNSEDWYYCNNADVLKMDLKALKGKAVMAKVEEKNGFKLCHGLRVIA